MENINNEEYVICPRCKQEVYKEAIICPFCKFGIMAWLEGEIDENGDLKKISLNKILSCRAENRNLSGRNGEDIL